MFICLASDSVTGTGRDNISGTATFCKTHTQQRIELMTFLGYRTYSYTD